MNPLTISSRGWILIPAQLQKKYDLQAGAQVMLVDYGGVLAIVPIVKNPIEAAQGLLKGGPSLLKVLKTDKIRNSE